MSRRRGGGRRGGGKGGSGGQRPTPKAPTCPPGTLAVDGHSARWLRQGFPWVYPQEVVGGGPVPAGTLVRLMAPDGGDLGCGVADSGWLAVRRFRDDEGPLDRAWLAQQVDRAVRLRERSVLSDATTACRLIHGENDGLPGIRVDSWDGWLVVILDSPSLAVLLPDLVEVLAARVPCHGVHLSYRLDPRDTLDPDRLDPAPGWLRGEAPPDDVTVLERGLALRVRPGEGADVGAFPDMRDVRAWLEPHWRGRRVLNTFAHTGAFSVAAALHGASEVCTVDLSGAYLERAVANAVANGLDGDAIEPVEDDVFKALDRFRRTGRRFDLVVLDPPSFSHGPTGTWSAKQDMPRLVAAAARVLDDDGWIVAASNQGQLSPKAFRGLVADGLKKAGRLGRELTFLGAAVDHPSAVTFPEAHYLKVGVWALD